MADLGVNDNEAVMDLWDFFTRKLDREQRDREATEA